MLTAEGAFELPGVDGVVVHPDDTLVQGFYVLSTVPRVAVDAAGQPEIALTVYGRRENGVFAPAGALLTLTTVLAVPEPDLARARAALAVRVAGRWPADAPTDPPPLVLLAPDWESAAVEVRLLEGVTLEGNPSLGADQRCSWSTKLDAGHARTLQQAWAHGLPDASITYRGHLRAAGTPTVWTQAGDRTRTSTRTSASCDEDGGPATREERASARSTTVAAQGAGPSVLEVAVSAPFAVSVVALAARASVTEL